MIDDPGFGDWSLEWRRVLDELPFKTTRVKNTIGRVPVHLEWNRERAKKGERYDHGGTLFLEDIRKKPVMDALIAIGAGRYRINNLGDAGMAELRQVLSEFEARPARVSVEAHTPSGEVAAAIFIATYLDLETEETREVTTVIKFATDEYGQETPDAYQRLWRQALNSSLVMEGDMFSLHGLQFWRHTVIEDAAPPPPPGQSV